jgi:hypothetical protein
MLSAGYDLLTGLFFSIDIDLLKCYYIKAIQNAYARVVELADSLDSGSSVQYARAGSSPASRTNNRKGLKVFRSFQALAFFPKILTSSKNF